MCFETLASVAACGKSLFIFDLQRFAEACVAVQEADGKLVLTLPAFRQDGEGSLELKDATGKVYGILEYKVEYVELGGVLWDNLLTLTGNAANLKEINLSSMGANQRLTLEGTVPSSCRFSGFSGRMPMP